MDCRLPIVWLLIGLAWTACVVGCSKSDVETVPVYGNVTFANRQQPAVCRLFFQQIQTDSITRPTSAVVQPDGEYQAKAFRDSKGLVPGTYKIRVSYYDLKPGANPDLDTSYVESSYDAGELVVDASAGSVEHNIEVPGKS